MVGSAVRAPIPTLSSIAAIRHRCRGRRLAAVGLSFALNPVFPTIPLGTLAANLVGGLMMGVAMELITRHTLLSPEARLLVATGFMAGSRRFDVFGRSHDADRTSRWIGLLTIGLHVVGSVALTMVGLLPRGRSPGDNHDRIAAAFHVHENRRHHHVLLYDLLERRGSSAFAARPSRDRLRSPRHSSRRAFLRAYQRCRRRSRARPSRRQANG